MRKYEVSIKYGSTSEDIHHIIIDANTLSESLLKGKQWANDNRLMDAVVCHSCQIDHEDFSDISEWDLDDTGDLWQDIDVFLEK